MKCDKCGFESENGKFCPNCGNSLSSDDNQKQIKTEKKIICDKCGFKNEENSKFCTKCSNPLQTKTLDNLDLPKNKDIEKDVNKDTENIKNSNNLENKTIKCNKCGYKNPADTLYCGNCSNNLINNKNGTNKLKIIIPSVAAIIILLFARIFAFNMFNQSPIIKEIKEGNVEDYYIGDLKVTVPNTWTSYPYYYSDSLILSSPKDENGGTAISTDGEGYYCSYDSFVSHYEDMLNDNQNSNDFKNLKGKFITDNLFRLSYKNSDNKNLAIYGLYDPEGKKEYGIFLIDSPNNQSADFKGIEYIIKNISFN